MDSPTRRTRPPTPTRGRPRRRLHPSTPHRKPRLHLRTAAARGWLVGVHRQSRSRQILPRGHRSSPDLHTNALAAIDALVGIDHIVKIVKVVGFVSSSPGFNGQPAILNGASELLVDIFGDDGTHARSAVGVAELPRNVPVEVEMIVEVRSA
ncbi:endoribonuclease L-PSP [Rhodococcus wratislaviensis IFP 2016]|nr:endoribonuclease L-PSP [Rhodococcus wratislaviensis IFP 2016]